MTIPLFLMGGGQQSEGHPLTYGPFLKASSRAAGRKIAVIIDISADDGLKLFFERYRLVFESLGAATDEIVPIFSSATKTLTKDKIAQHQPTGVFVAGGLTPHYHDALCNDCSWFDYLIENNIPYAGFSAGAAIAASQAIVGGWQVEIKGRKVAILDQDLAENLDLLEVRPGLGLVPFAVDVHASQWGTLTRLLHALDLGLVVEGWAIDEDTMLHLEAGQMQVRGLGQAYHVQKSAAGKLAVEIVRANNHFS